MRTRVALAIPTRNAGSIRGEVILSIQRQTRSPDEWIVIDSCSEDGTAHAFAAAGATVVSIDPSTYDHGGTRQAVCESSDADVVVFMTQDAVLASPDSLGVLVAQFDDPAVAAAYGRQIPQPSASAVERYARLTNYPVQSSVHTLQDASKLGIRAAFCSNSFAGWRRSSLQAVGGFPSPCILGEDMLAAARLLQAGYAVAYCADAAVVHSHDLTMHSEMRRYFDTGVMHASNPWLLDTLGPPDSAGAAFVFSELRWLVNNGAARSLPEAVARSANKFLAYRLGRQWRHLPRSWCRSMSGNPAYWNLLERGNEVA